MILPAGTTSQMTTAQNLALAGVAILAALGATMILLALTGRRP